MQRWLKFETRFTRESNFLSVRLYECSPGKYFAHEVPVGVQYFSIIRWWHTAADVDRKIKRARAILLRDYLRSAPYHMMIQQVADSNAAIIDLDNPEPQLKKQA